MPDNSLALDRSYLDVLFDHFPTAVMVADDRACYVDVNQAACQLLGRARDQIVGHHLSAIVAPGRMAEVDLQWRAFLRDGAQQGLFDVTLPNGSVRPVQFHARANFVPGLHCSFLTSIAARQPSGGPGDDHLTLCAWSKRVLHKGQWLTLEQYLLDAHGLTVSHGISPEAFAEVSTLNP